jgi:hypothetical protein
VTLSNPATGAREAATSYTRALLELLGDREPLGLMDGLAKAVRGALDGVPADVLRRPESPGKWSLLETARHLVDTEVVYGYRTRLVVAQDEPSLPGYDQDRWAARLHYLEGDPALLVEELSVLRRMNVRFYRSLSAAERERWGMHSERGRESVDRIVKLLAAHDLVHRQQMQRIRRAHGLAPTEEV